MVVVVKDFSDTFPTCTGPCAQGRRKCPTPDACCIKEDDSSEARYLAAAVIVCALAVLGAMVFLFR